MFILSSIANARELGGYVLPDGRRIRHGLLLRGGALGTASQEDLDEMADVYHVTKVFDFRTSTELNILPDKPVRGAQGIWMPAFNEDSQSMELLTFPPEAYRDLGNWLVRNASNQMVRDAARLLYIGLVRNEFTQIQYAGFLQNIVNTTDGAVYWHCSQGKDRTGLGAAFILAALGADRELIMKDFDISNIFYADEVARYKAMLDKEEEKAVIQTFVGVSCEAFSAALDLIDSTYGSLYGYLTGPLCLSDEDMEVLRRRYLE